MDLPKAQQVTVEPGGETDIYARLAISHDALERIERSRKAEGKIELNISYGPRMMVVKEPNVNVAGVLRVFSDKGVIGAYIHTPVSDTMDLVQLSCPVIDPRTYSESIKLTTEEWLDILSKVGYRKCRIIEIPAIDGDEKIKLIIEELDRAWKLMAENYHESLNACRKALERIKEYVINLGFESNGKVDFKKIYEGEKFGECMDKIFTSLWCLTSVGSHAGRSKMTTTADMEFIITSVYLLLKSLLEVTGSHH